MVELGNGITEADLLVHDAQAADPSLAFMLARMDYPDFPVPVGIFRSVQKPTYDELLEAQVQDSVNRMGPGNLEKLLNSGDTWVVE